MLRFIIIDEFGGRLRAFATKREAKQFILNKRGCSVFEIDLDAILGECLL